MDSNGESYNKEETKQEERIQEKLMVLDVGDRNSIRFVCISDTHSNHQLVNLPEGDVLIHCGDFTSLGMEDEVEEFADFLRDCKFQHKIVIAGNHEVTFDEKNNDRLLNDFEFDKNETPTPTELKKLISDHCTYLENSGVSIGGYNIWGSPNTPEFEGWAFMESEEEINKIWDKIPSNTDILLTHGPPQGILDKCENGSSAGSSTLLHQVINRIKPMYHFFGHIHEAYGQFKHSETNTIFANISTCTYRLRPDNKPYVFELPVRKSLHSDRQSN